jgi:hypothetical protein
MIDADDRALMEQTLRRAIADAQDAAGADADVGEALAGLGWLEMLAEEPDDAIEVVFGALGVANAQATALDDVLARGLGLAPRDDLAVLLPPFAGWEPPGRIEGEAVHARGLATARVATAGDLAVVCGPATAPRLATLSARSADVRPVRGVDPGAGLHAVRAEERVADAAPLDAVAWAGAVALGRRALARQIAGACRTMLQFGRPIARFQAVRHRLAEALVALEALEAALDAARQDPDPQTAALAKAVAGRSAHTVAAHGQQVLAGIGFTTEHAFHRFLKRTLALEGLFGSADAIVLDLGRRLLATRRVPTLIEL